VFKHTRLPTDKRTTEVNYNPDGDEVNRRFKELGSLGSPVKVAPPPPPPPPPAGTSTGEGESKGGGSGSPVPSVMSSAFQPGGSGTSQSSSKGNNINKDVEKWTGKQYERLQLPELDRDELVEQFSPLQFGRIKEDRLMYKQHHDSTYTRSVRMQQLARAEAAGGFVGAAAASAAARANKGRSPGGAAGGGAGATGGAAAGGAGMPKSERSFLSAFAAQRLSAHPLHSDNSGGGEGGSGFSPLLQKSLSLNFKFSLPGAGSNTSSSGSKLQQQQQQSRLLSGTRARRASQQPSSPQQRPQSTEVRRSLFSAPSPSATTDAGGTAVSPAKRRAAAPGTTGAAAAMGKR
jgi:hypothetical protein